MLAGLALCSAATAAEQNSTPVLIGKTMLESRSAGRIVVCKYSEANVRYEVVSDSGTCAPSLDMPSLANAERVATLRANSVK